MFEIQFEKKKQDDRLCMGHFSICADPLVVPASINVLELSGETTVRSKAAGLPSVQLGTRKSAGRLLEASPPDPYPTSN